MISSSSSASHSTPPPDRPGLQQQTRSVPVGYCLISIADRKVRSYVGESKVLQALADASKTSVATVPVRSECWSGRGVACGSGQAN
jgi:hypothetical protein